MKDKFIYKITNIKNKKVYIGESCNPIKRFQVHKKNAKKNKDTKHSFYIDLNNNPDFFKLEILDKTSHENRLRLEQYYIQLYDSYNNGYNRVPYGGANYGKLNPNYGNKWSNEQKQNFFSKIKDKRKGILNGNYGNTGLKAKNNIKTYMYDDDYNLIKTFHTVGLALKFLNVKGNCQLDKAIKNNTKYKGYYWKKDSRSVTTIESIIVKKNYNE